MEGCFNLRRTGLVETRRTGLWIHYRLANASDPVIRAIADAVRHALTQLDVVGSDTERNTPATVMRRRR